VIEFVCKNCGQKISVHEKHAGKEIRCPECHNIIFIPKAESTDTAENQNNSEQIETAFDDPVYDPALLNISEKEKLLALQKSQSNTSYEQEIPEKSKSAEELIDQRKFSWPIDILLYPSSKAGMINFAIIIGALPLTDIMWHFLPSMVSCLFYLITIAVKVFIFLYLYWYITECVRNSADGFVRAPEGLRAVSSLADMFGQTVNIIGCFGVFLGPFVVYSMLIGGVDMISWLLLGFAIFLYPMGLLSVIMFDSVQGLKPRLLITSIHNTFIPYSGLVLLFVLLTILCIVIFEQAQISQFWRIAIRSVIIYSALICAHLLGRFYWRYQEKLDWGI
jgi:DNA-directed RNA polymerase subunit RPC12/RpoP